MSTFGKKALIWWNYEDHSHESALRFNSTKKDIQLAILEKWYPIGSKCRIYYNEKNTGSMVYEIVGYTEYMSYWNIKVRSVNLPSGKNSLVSYDQTDSKHPMRVALDDSVKLSIKRDNKLEKLNIN